ncbi:hypothetical protein HRbin15_01151 [bacterium HR15]|nr:hypothetical protein HRbin15_01151 [bacterium HR15]
MPHNSQELAKIQREIDMLRKRLPKAPRGSKEAVLAIAGLWAGESEELEQLLQRVSQERAASLEDILFLQ